MQHWAHYGELFETAPWRPLHQCTATILNQGVAGVEEQGSGGPDAVGVHRAPPPLRWARQSLVVPRVPMQCAQADQTGPIACPRPLQTVARQDCALQVRRRARGTEGEARGPTQTASAPCSSAQFVNSAAELVAPGGLAAIGRRQVACLGPCLAASRAAASHPAAEALLAALSGQAAKVSSRQVVGGTAATGGTASLAPARCGAYRPLAKPCAAAERRCGQPRQYWVAEPPRAGIPRHGDGSATHARCGGRRRGGGRRRQGVHQPAGLPCPDPRPASRNAAGQGREHGAARSPAKPHQHQQHWRSQQLRRRQQQRRQGRRRRRPAPAQAHSEPGGGAGDHEQQRAAAPTRAQQKQQQRCGAGGLVAGRHGA